jgi:hypothetical protein
MIRYGSLHLDMNANNSRFPLFIRVYFKNEDKIVPQPGKQEREMTLRLALLSSAMHFPLAFLVVSNFTLFSLFFLQLRKPVSTLSIPSMKTGVGNRETNRDAACNEEAGLALVDVRSEYPRYVNTLATDSHTRREHIEIMSDIFIASVSSIEIFMALFLLV